MDINGWPNKANSQEGVNDYSVIHPGGGVFACMHRTVTEIRWSESLIGSL